jgi:glycosyltransferase involved in cell wall biosynthesis
MPQSPMRDTGPYREFLRRLAANLAATPETTVSLLSGRNFLDLRPDVFEAVRQGESEFGLPCEEVYEDLIAARDRRQRTCSGRVHCGLIRSLKRAVMQLRLLAVLWLVFPLTSRRMRRRIADDAPRENRPARGDRPAQRAAPRVSIVVLSYNRLAYLRNTIDAVLETTQSVQYELIVVDNGSQDGSVEFLKDARRQGHVAKLVLLRENLGISAGYNYGFAVADERSEYLMKLDGDIQLLSDGWLAKVVGFLAANRQVGFVALTQVNHPMLRLPPRLRMGGQDVMDFVEWPSGGAMVIPKRVRCELGDFIEDGQMKYAPDDIDYGARAVRKGYRALFLRKVLVYHQTDLDKSAYRDYNSGKPAVASSQLALQLAREYDRGVRPLEIHEPKYRPLRLPEDAVFLS